MSIIFFMSNNFFIDMSSRGGPSCGGPSRADKRKAPMVEPEVPQPRPLNAMQNRH